MKLQDYTDVIFYNSIINKALWGIAGVYYLSDGGFIRGITAVFAKTVKNYLLMCNMLACK